MNDGVKRETEGGEKENQKDKIKVQMKICCMRRSDIILSPYVFYFRVMVEPCRTVPSRKGLDVGVDIIK